MQQTFIDEGCRSEENSTDNLPTLKQLYENRGISSRTFHCLIRAGILTLEDVAARSYEDLRKIRNLGPVTLSEVMRILRKYNLQLKEPEKAGINASVDEKETVDTLKSIPLLLELMSVSEKAQDGDYAGLLVHLEKAVELGYRKDYSIIGKIYLAGAEGVSQDYAKGLKWLQRFYDDFKAGNLELGEDDKGVIIDACHKLGLVCFIELQKENYPTTLRDQKIKDILNIWRDAVNYAQNRDDSETSADRLYNIGCCFYYGEIKIIDNAHNLEIHFEFQSDYEYAYKALAEAERLGNVAAITLLAEMYEEGKYVIKDDVVASIKYIEAAIKGDEDATEWCQKHYIDELPWEKLPDWSDVIMMENFPKIITQSAKQIGCNNLEELRNFKFTKLKEKGISIGKANLRQLFVYVANFVNNYKSASDADIRSTIGLP